MSSEEKPMKMPKMPSEVTTENREFIEEGLRRGHQHAQEGGLEIGQFVCHPSDNIVYALKSVEGDIATIWIPAGKANNDKDIIRKVPYAELYDPKAAYKGAIKAKVEASYPSAFKPKKDIN